MSRACIKEISRTVQEVINSATMDVVSISEDRNSKIISVVLEYKDLDGDRIGIKTAIIANDNYVLLMSANPTFAPNKPIGEYREPDLWFILDYIDTGSPILWAEKTDYAVGDIRYYGKIVYTCTTAGTSGTTAPTATNGTVIDGTVVWTYKETLG